MKSRARRAVDQFCVMSTAVDRPEVVQPPVEEEIIPSARNRRAATQRVREARDRLTSTSGTRPAFDHELLRQYAQTRLSASYVVMLLVVATGLLFGLWLGPVAAGGWTVGVLLVHAVIIRTSAAFLKEPANQAVTRRTRLQFIIYDLVYGLCWTAILVYPSGIDLLSNTFLMVLMLLVVAVSSMLSSTLPIAAFAATAPVTAAIAVNFALRGTLENYFLAFLAVAAEGYFILLAYRLHTTTLATIEARAEKDALIGELEQAKAISDEARHRAESANVAKSRFLAHAAQRHPRLLRGDEERDLRPPCGAGLQGLFGRHSQFRRPPAQPHQRNPRPVAH